MKPHKIYIPFLLLLIAGLSISCGNISNSIQVQNWEIRYEQDSASEPDLKDCCWEAVDIPSVLHLPNPLNKKFQNISLRAKFKIKNDPTKYYGLSTGRIGLTDKIFINDSFIGSLSPKKITWSPLPRNYIIPKGILKKGSNTVSIQLGLYGKYHGGILNDVLVQPEEDFDRTQLINSVIYNKLPFGIAVLFTGMIIMQSAFLLLDRKEKASIYGLLANIGYLMFMYMHHISYQHMSYELVLALYMLFVALTTIFMILIIQSMYRVYLTKYNRIIFPVLLIAALILLINRDSIYNCVFCIIIVSLSLITIVIYFPFMIRRLNSIKPDKFTSFFTSLFTVVFFLIVIFEMYSRIAGLGFTDFSAMYLPAIFIFLFSLSIAREFVEKKNEIKLLYDKLKKNDDREVLITESSEEKLNRVIDFIRDNYTSDLSREGLAAAVELNPNYMGTLFKTYTGKKINDYISQLRVQDAIKKLEADNSRIIDVAFSVGFESIVTFNRAFKKETGKTPSEFKTI